MITTGRVTLRKVEVYEGKVCGLDTLCKMKNCRGQAVIADGNRITYKINGEVTTDMTDNSPNARKDGVIALQMHAGFDMTIQFKGFKIKMLPATK